MDHNKHGNFILLPTVIRYKQEVYGFKYKTDSVYLAN